MLRIGIDPSLNSTGLALKHDVCGVTTLVGFSPLKTLPQKMASVTAVQCGCARRQLLLYCLQNIQGLVSLVDAYANPAKLQVAIFHYDDDKSVSHDRRIEERTETMVNYIGTYARLTMTSKITLMVTLEAVPLHMTHSSSTSILRDFSAVLRNKLQFRLGIRLLLSEVSPSTVKKRIAGSGKSDKPAMYRAFYNHWRSQNFPVRTIAELLFFGFDRGPNNLISGLAKPLQDMVDADCICRDAENLANGVYTVKKRKRFAVSQQ